MIRHCRAESRPVPVHAAALRRCRAVLAGAVFAALAPCGSSVRAEAPVLVPHAARYALSLHASSAGGEVSALSGRMEMRFARSCDGWRIEQALAFRMLALEGTRLEHLAQFDAFEEADGSGLVFNARTWEDRELVDVVSGRARRREDGLVEVRYASPDAYSELLPAGTLFPGQHVQAVVAAAHGGRRVTMNTVFDGSSADGPFEISTVIGDAGTGATDLPRPLAGLVVWPVRLAYFDLGAVEPEADFEMSVRLYANGVAGDMIYDYGGFAIDVSLEDVTILDTPRCTNR